jgi:type IV pilus assembly protein PilB
VAAGVKCVVAQRLVRRLCECRVPVKLSKAALLGNHFDVTRGFAAYDPGSCVRCAGTGFRGRIGVYELMRISDEQRRLILAKSSADELRACARREGMRTLREDGLEKVKLGVTSLGEVLRVLGTSA